MVTKSVLPAPTHWRSIVTLAVKSRTMLWAAFIAVHLWLGVLNLYGPGWPLGDVDSVYKYWARLATTGHFVVGIDAPWVYPVVALVPMLICAIFGFGLYSSTWLSLVMVLNAVAFAYVTRDRIAIGGSTGGRVVSRGYVAGWWWVAFLIVLGPISLGRIDSVTVPLAIVGIVYIARRPAVASVILTIAAWIKVWPAIIVLTMAIAVRARRTVLLAAGLASFVIVVISVILGSGLNVFSFITQQTNRGLQIESPVSTIWLWQAFAGVPGTFLYYDRALMTYQVAGSSVAAVSSLMTPLLAVVVLGIALLGVRAVRSGASVGEVLTPLTLAFITALIAFNKVGSPQFMSWLAVPIIIGLASHVVGVGRSVRVPAIIVLLMAGFTQSFYPYLYGYLLALDPVMLVLLSIRNVLVFVVLGWAVVALWTMARGPGSLPFISDRILEKEE